MRHAMLALFGLLSVSTATMVAAGPAAAFDYPYCIQGREVGIPGDCSYPSYQACMAAASGRGVYCNINPVVAFRQLQPQPNRRGQPYPNYDYND